MLLSFCKKYGLLLCFLAYIASAKAQCAGGITSFPYVEDFETSAAWTSSGAPCTPLGLVINDWRWGHPQKNVINSAGSGQRCWIVGDTVGWLYAYGERAWVQSPCFNFTSIQHPYMQFKIWWELEYKYDGAVLQYSTNNGASWTNVGAFGDATDCMDTNWYNYSNITNIGSYSHSLPGHGNTSQTYPALSTVKSGWCGNIQTEPPYADTTGVSASTCQTGGPAVGHWVTAKHCMPYLAGQSGVLFRFAFGAGTSCNNFNGFAFDSVAIGDAAPNTADFTHTCVNTNTLSFAGIATLCPDTFQWNFGDPGSGASNTIMGAGSLNATHTFSAPGTYNVTFTVKGGPCNAPGTVTKTVNVIGVTATPINELCNGGNTGGVIAVLAGNASPYTYNWNTTPAQHTDTATALPIGTYTVTVTTANACSATASGQISQPTALTHTSTTTPAACGSATGSAKVTESNGTPPYSYVWSNSLGSADSIKNVASGSYVLTVTDAHGCTDVVTVTIGNGGGITALLGSQTNESCHGDNTGSITINTSGGTTPYTYHWGTVTNANSTQVGFAAGSYIITVSDANGCSATVPVSITEPAALVHATTTTLAACGASDGSAQVIESGGTPTYSYLWSGGHGTADSIINVPAGSYTLTVTDAHGCADTISVSVANTGGATVNVTNITNVTCPGGSDGSITVSATGGSTPYTYHWTSSITNTNTTQGSFSAGTYVITVTDNAGCIATVSATVSAPSAIIPTPTAIAVSCHNATDGSASISVIGGTPGYTYFWNVDSATTSISNMAPGIYTVTVTDQHSCTASASSTISNPDSLIIMPTVLPQSCANHIDGSITLNVSGGTPLYTYQWAPVGGNVPSLTGLSAGPYSYTVTDSHNCSVSGTSTVVLSAAIIPNPTLTEPECPPLTNGSIVVSPAGGNPAYNYTWSNASQSAINGQLGAGTYYLTITDSRGCTLLDTFMLAYTGQLTVEAGYDQTIDLGETATLNAVTTGGNDISYVWSPDYHLTCITCQSPDATPFQTFTYIVNVIDTSGCRASDSVTIFVNKTYNLYVPNAFTPNGNGTNDSWEIFGNKKTWKFVHILIFNRWGEKIFESNDINFQWDGTYKGTLQEPNVYVYVLDVTFIDGYTIAKQKGSITLIR